MRDDMKRYGLSILIYMLCGVLAVVAEASSSETVPGQSVRHVVTALDHLTVLDYDEPVVQAAAGSSAFQIERQDNKVFIKPLRAGVSTNLFIWTSSNQVFGYELSVGDVTGMNAAIHTVVSKPAKTADTSAQIDQLADVAVTQVLLSAQSIESADIKPSRASRIRLRVEQVLPSRNILYVQYTLENLGSRPYRITAPNVFELELEHPRLNPLSVRGKQIDRKVLEELGNAREIPLRITHAENESNDIGPGMHQHGIIAVQRKDARKSPSVLQIVFDTEVKATVVF